MARPPRIEKLRHGKLLCGSVFRFFVETWNWLVGYVDNMKGDADVNPQSGHITIDRTDPDHPVVRFRADKAAGGGATPDDKSLDATGGSDGKSLEIKAWGNQSRPASTAFAADMGATNPTGDMAVVRKTDGSLAYKPVGVVVSGSDSNISISANGNNLEINVYYR